MKPLLLTVLGLSLCACGGGGGDGSDGGGSSAPFFGGVYDVTTELFRDTCRIGADPVHRTVHTVNQIGGSVALDIQGGGSFAGTVNPAGTGFAVTGPSAVASVQGLDCVGTTGVAYEGFDSPGGPVVVEAITVECGGVKTCDVVWVGTAHKRR